MSSRPFPRVTSLVVLAATFAAGATLVSSPPLDSTFDTVRAKTFELLDARGETLFTLTAMPQGFPGVLLAWRDKPEAFASLLVAPGGEVMLSMHDVKRRAKVGISLGNFDAAKLTLESLRTKSVAVFGLEGNGALIVGAPGKESK